MTFLIRCYLSGPKMIQQVSWFYHSPHARQKPRAEQDVCHFCCVVEEGRKKKKKKIIHEGRLNIEGARNIPSSGNYLPLLGSADSS